MVDLVPRRHAYQYVLIVLTNFRAQDLQIHFCCLQVWPVYPRPSGRVFIQTHGIPNMDFLCNAENRIARTKNAVNLLGQALQKNAQLLGTSNAISFLLAATDVGGRKKSVTTTRKTIIVAMTIWDSLALLWSLGWMKSRSEGRDRPRGPTSKFMCVVEFTIKINVCYLADSRTIHSVL